MTTNKLIIGNDWVTVVFDHVEYGGVGPYGAFYTVHVTHNGEAKHFNAGWKVVEWATEMEKSMRDLSPGTTIRLCRSGRLNSIEWRFPISSLAK